MRTVVVSVLSVALATAVGCSANDEAAMAVDAGASPDAGNTTKAESIAFESASTLTLAPGAKATLQVLVLPAGEHQVRFSLVGDSLDGSLDADTMRTTPEGKAAVVLTAPQSATTFRVRAIADDGPWAETAVSVSGTGFATVKVVPKYGGTRNTPEWTMTGAALVTCADGKGIPPPDGPIATTLESGKPLLLEGLPAGAKLAITVRSGHALGGCADVTPLSAGEQREVEVNVVDRPIELSQTDVSVEMLTSPDGTVLKPWLDSETEKFAKALAPQGSETSALLDEMGGAAADAAEFAALRVQQGWDAKTKDYFTALGKPLTERVKGWAAKGVISLLSGSVLAGRVAMNGSVPELRVDTVGGLDAKASGSGYVYTIVLSADSGDTIHIGGGLTLVPSGLIASAADASAASSGVPDAVAAMQEVVGCAELAKVLDGAGGEPSSCGLACLDQLCQDALGKMWERARASSFNSFEVAHISFTASAHAQVDDEAVIRKFDGTWAGELNTVAETVVLSGSVSGVAEP